MIMDISKMLKSSSSSPSKNESIVEAIRTQINEQARILSVYVEKSNSLELKVSKIERENVELNKTVQELQSQLNTSQTRNASLQSQLEQLEAERTELISYVEVLREELNGQRSSSVSEVHSLLQKQDQEFYLKTITQNENLVHGHKKAALIIAHAIKTDKDFLNSLTEQDIIQMMKAHPRKMEYISRLIRNGNKRKIFKCSEPRRNYAQPAIQTFELDSIEVISIGMFCGILLFSVLGILAVPLIGVVGIAATIGTIGAFGVSGSVVGGTLAVTLYD